MRRVAFQGIPDEHVAALRVPTPPGWADVALSDLRATMSDHAHAEKKAALNALSLLSREPHRTELVRRMARLAQEELSHLDAVLRYLRSRSWTLAADRPDRYAGALLQLRRSGGGQAALADRLLIAALIEARSWERLHLLGMALDDADAESGELGDFYRELAASEAGHYRLFVELARSECPDQDVDARLDELAEVEARIVTTLPHEPRIH